MKPQEAMCSKDNIALYDEGYPSLFLFPFSSCPLEQRLPLNLDWIPGLTRGERSICGQTCPSLPSQPMKEMETIDSEFLGLRSMMIPIFLPLVLPLLSQWSHNRVLQCPRGAPRDQKGIAKLKIRSGHSYSRSDFRYFAPLFAQPLIRPILTLQFSWMTRTKGEVFKNIITPYV